MNIALLIPFGLSASLLKLARWLPVHWTKSCRVASTPIAANQPCIQDTGDCTPELPVANLRGTDCNQPAHRPLRVVRVLEVGQPKSHSGRMLISGCMSDVCAELDRLAAAEATLS